MKSLPFHALITVSLVAQDALPMEDAAKHLLTIAASAGFQGRIACRDLDMSVALKRQGISTDPRSSIAWAATAPQVELYQTDRKLILCGDKALLQQGAAIALVSEGGRLVIYLHSKHATLAAVPVPEPILKIARRIN